MAANEGYPESGVTPASLEDYRELARRRLPRVMLDTLEGGSFGEVTMNSNVNDLRQLELRQRVLRDVTTRSLSTTVLGQEISMPVILAPIGFGGMFAQRAEVQAARAAERAKIPFCEAALAICSVEEVAAAVTQPVWFQLYMMKDRAYTADLMSRAQAMGSTTLVLTVDVPVNGVRYRDIRNGVRGGLSLARRLRRDVNLLWRWRWMRDVALRGRPLTPGNFSNHLLSSERPDSFLSWISDQWDPSVTWDDLAWVRDHWHGKIAIKGILDPQDAREAVARGVDGVIVSNHGGRQLDQVPSSIRALPGIAQAVGNECEVLMDGGIRSGLDVVKALSLGARACLIGRPWVYAVAARGEVGVEHMLGVLREEMMMALSLVGVSDIRDIDRSIVLER